MGDGGGVFSRPAMLHRCRSLRGGLLEDNNRGGNIFLVTEMGSCTLSGVHGGFCSGVSGSTPPGSTQDGLGTAEGGNFKSTRTQAIHVILLYIGRVRRVPSGGLKGADDNAYQPPDSLCAPPNVRHDID